MPTHNPTDSKGMKEIVDKQKGMSLDKKEGQLVTAPTRNWRFSASYDSFVVAQTVVLRINICGGNRHLL
ncbi:MAG: hypothetical protein IPO21_17430 [Bacteroidales bacterium]|nr:hypothetical protein [Bacteroidales bacterium]